MTSPTTVKTRTRWALTISLYGLESLIHALQALPDLGVVCRHLLGYLGGQALRHVLQVRLSGSYSVICCLGVLAQTAGQVSQLKKRGALHGL